MKGLVVAFAMMSSFSNAQLISGAVIAENRKMITQTDFILEGMVDGVSEYELAVDREGNVTSERLTKTNIKSTPASVQIKNYLKKLKFEPGTYYPKAHHVIIRITMTTSKEG